MLYCVGEPHVVKIKHVLQDVCERLDRGCIVFQFESIDIDWFSTSTR